MENPVKKKPYSSQLRTDQARATQRAIVHAAAGLFIAAGYGATTIDAVAAAAGVSRKTVFTSVGGKLECLKLAIDWANAGDDEPAPVMARERIQREMQEPDARLILRNYAEMVREVSARSAELRAVLAQAVGLDAAIRALSDDFEGQVRFGMTNLAGHLDLRGALSRDLDVDDAAQLLCIYTDTSLYRRLVTAHGWSAERFTRWLGDALVGQLLRDDYEPKPLPRTKRAAALGVDTTRSS
jgi:AcrR family transcriptional regulator